MRSGASDMMSDQIAGASPAASVPDTAQDRLVALFPDSSSARDPRRRIQRTAIAIAVIVVLVVVSLLAKSAFASDAAAYRTATVEKRNVSSVLTGVGTIEPV